MSKTACLSLSSATLTPSRSAQPPIMADTTTTTGPTSDKGPEAVHAVDEPVGDLQLPRGWMYKSWGLGRWRTPWYASPRFQLGMVAFVCFMCPGMFNALGGLGGGGKADASLADQMVIVLHLC